MRARRFVLSAALVATVSGAGAPPATPLLRWLSANGTEAWRVRLDAPRDGVAPASLSTAPTFPPLPPVELRLLQGGAFKSADVAGSVLLLDFWASWCAPCLEELPHLQKLFDAERSRGLVAVAVNADEPPEIVQRAVARLGLKLPVGLYDDALREALSVRTLPTLVLADRQGRVRARWDGYTAGLERTIAERVRELLGDDPEGRTREIAKVLEGSGSFEVAWVRDLRAPVTGLAALGAARTDGAVVAVAAGDQLAMLGKAGDAVRRLKLSSAAWRLAAPPPRSATPDVLAYRVGSSEIVSIDLDQGLMREWTAPGPVFDVVFPPGARSEPPRVWLATLEGLGVSDLAGHDVRRVGGPTPLVSAVAEASGGVSVLSNDGAISSLDAAGRPAGTRGVAAGSRQVVGAPGLPGVGVAPDFVTARVVGTFTGGASKEAALATYGGELAIVDLGTGRVVFRASWPDIAALAAGDLDGDGRDELLVGSGRTVAALRARARGAADGR